MIGADTNLLVRFLVKDDPPQVEKVRALFENTHLEREPVFISEIAMCELMWVLEKGYNFDRTAIAVAIESLLADSTFAWQSRALVEQALADFKTLRGEFADHLIGAVAREHNCRTTFTFDKDLARSENFTVLK